MRKDRHRLMVIALAVLTIAAVFALNFGLQSMPLRDWLPRVVMAVAAVCVLLLVNLGWAGGIRAALLGAAGRQRS